jgi:HlyD family secretion protein
MAETINIFAKSGRKWAIALAGIGLVVVGATSIYALKLSNSPVTHTEVAPPPQAEIKAVSALGRIEPQGEVIELAPSPNMGGAKVAELSVKEGDRVKKGQIIAILDDYEKKQAEVERAEKEVKVAQANLAIVKAGAKQGEIKAQKATIARLKAHLEGEITTDKAKIARLKAQLTTEKQEKQAIIQRLQAELENARTEWHRYQQLATEGAISQSDLDQRRLVFDTAQQRYDEAQASYQKTVNTLSEEIKEAKAVASQSVSTLERQIEEAMAELDRIAEIRDVDVALAEAEVERAIASRQQAKADLELSYIKAPLDSQIIEIKTRPGENVNSDEGVVELGETQNMMVVAEVYESDIGKVKLGQQVVIQSENGAFKGEIRGKVANIGRKIGKNDVLDTDPAADVDARVVEVEIAIDSPDTERVANLTYSQVIVKILL